MSDEMRFFLFLIERYADHKGRPTGDVLREWDQKGVTQGVSASAFAPSAPCTRGQMAMFLYQLKG